MTDRVVSDSLSLSGMLTSKTVRAMVTVESWEEATDFVGGILLKAGLILPRYILAMKQALKDMGSYAVIAPGIVLLHARPEDGVVSPCLGLITLSDPVPFGHSENDPVDIVVAIGAVDKKAHVVALQQLAKLLGDPAKLQRIRSAESDSSLLEIFS